MTDRPLSVNINLFFILLNALLWFIFGFIIAVNAHPALPDIPWMKAIMAGLSFAIVALLAVSFFYLLRHNAIAYYLLLLFFIFASIATIFDDFGYTDLVFVAISLVPVVLLIKDRAWYLQLKNRSEGTP